MSGILGLKYGGNVSEGGKKQGDKDRGGGGHTSAGGGRGTLGQQQDRRNMDAARRAGNRAPGVGLGMGSFGGRLGQPTRDQFQDQDRIAANVAKAQRDYRDESGESWFDRNIANPLADLFGARQLDPTRPGFSAPGAPGHTGRADWGFDPAGLIGGLAGSAIGIPGLGLLASAISSAAGRPFERNLGPDFFGGTPSGAPAGGGGIADLFSGGMGGRSIMSDRGGNGKNNRVFNIDSTQNTKKQQPQSSSTTNQQTNSSGYPIGGRVNPYLGDITQYAFGPMWDWLLYPGDPGYKDGGSLEQEAAEFRSYVGRDKYTSPNHRPRKKAKGGLPRHPAGQVNGPGGPKDDLVGPIALSNKEYVLPFEMVKHFGKGDYNKGIDALELIRKKVIK